jgi:hypothetical protein
LRIQNYVHGHAGARAFRQRIGELLCDLAAPEELSLEIYLPAR